MYQNKQDFSIQVAHQMTAFLYVEKGKQVSLYLLIFFIDGTVCSVE